MSLSPELLGSSRFTLNQNEELRLQLDNARMIYVENEVRELKVDTFNNIC